MELTAYRACTLSPKMRCRFIGNPAYFLKWSNSTTIRLCRGTPRRTIVKRAQSPRNCSSRRSLAPLPALLQYHRHQAALERERTFSEGDSHSQNFRKLFQAVFSNQPFAFFRENQCEIKMPRSLQVQCQGVHTRLRQESGLPECHYAEAMHLRVEPGGIAMNPKWTQSNQA